MGESWKKTRLAPILWMLVASFFPHHLIPHLGFWLESVIHEFSGKLRPQILQECIATEQFPEGFIWQKYKEHIIFEFDKGVAWLETATT